jgi:ABC-type dipeptide/oligopeptide/nickel transport system permease subunit
MYGYPSLQHPFGLDTWGHDILSRVIYGARTVLFICLTAVAIELIIGVTIGATGGHQGGKIGDLTSSLIDIFLIFPSFLFIMVIIKAFDIFVIGTPWESFPYRIFIIVFMIGFFGWPPLARITRAEFLKFKNYMFVEAAKSLGASDLRVIFKHIIPNALPPIIVVATLSMASAIEWEAGLAFLGFGDANVPDWGFMLQLAKADLSVAWWEAVYPGIAIFLAILAFNLLGDGLNEALNPRLRN